MAKDSVADQNKEILKNTKELTKVSAKLPSAFKGVINNLKDINVDVAKAAADIANNSSDTFASALAARKSLKVQEKFKNDSEFIKVNQAVKDSLKIRETLEQERTDRLETALKSTNKLGELDKKIADKIEVSAKLQGAALNNQMKSIEELQKKRKKTEEQILSSVDKRIEIEEKESEKYQLAAKEINDEKLKQMKEANNSDGFDKFTAGIKTMTGGLVDIAAPLDAITKQWSAAKDVVGFLATPIKKLGGFMNKSLEMDEERLEGQQDGIDQQEDNTGTLEKISKRLGFLLLGITTSLLLISAGILLPIIAIGAAIGLILAAFEAGAFTGAATAVKKAIEGAGKVIQSGADMVAKGWKGLQNRFSKLFPPKPKMDKVPKGVKLKADGTPDKRFKGQGQGLKAGDDVVKEVAKSGGMWSGLKKGLGAIVKKLPIIGAVVEGAVDVDEQMSKFEALKKQREAGTLKIKGADGEMRDMSDDEFEKLETAHEANLVGSTGKATGAFAGALAGGAAGAKAGAFIGSFFGPGIGTAIGGFLGGVGGAIVGGILGGQAGDDMATDLGEAVVGGENSQAVIDQALMDNSIEVETNLSKGWKAVKETVSGGDDLANATEDARERKELNMNNINTSSVADNSSIVTGGQTVIGHQVTTDQDHTLQYAN
jgi:hypothetical protein